MFYRDDNLRARRRASWPRCAASCSSQGQRNRQVPRVAAALLDAMWRQVRGERGRERGREEFVDTMLGTDGVRRLRAAPGGRRSTPTDVLGWLRDPELLGRVAEGVLDRDEQALLSRRGPGPRAGASGSPPTTGRSRTSPLLDELRYQLGDVPEKPRGDRDDDPTRWRTWSTRTCPS